MNKAYLLIGGNLGEREELIRLAEKQIESNCGPIISASSLYETEAWGLKEQPTFLNKVILIETLQDPLLLLRSLQSIELLLGRTREQRWGPRTMDIDILFYNKIILDTSNLTIPHPGIPNRRFVLEPLAEIAGEWEHPQYQNNIRYLLQQCNDNSAVRKFR